MGRKEGSKHQGTLMGALCIYKAASMISLKENSDHVILLLEIHPQWHLRPAVSTQVGFPDGSVVKNSPGDAGTIPGSERSPGEEMATHSSILAWKIPWTEEPGRL